MNEHGDVMPDYCNYSNYLIGQPIKDEAYKELEAIVGPEFITREPAVLDGYAWQPLWNKGPEMYLHRPIAVVLPASTEEVQAIVALLQQAQDPTFKAFCTGWGVFAGCHDGERDPHRAAPHGQDPRDRREEHVHRGGAPRHRRPDHRRVHEPGPALPHRLLGAGFLAPGQRHLLLRLAPDGTYMNWSPRNLLGVEWVLPDGEIVRLGSLGSTGEWFSRRRPRPLAARRAARPPGRHGRQRRLHQVRPEALQLALPAGAGARGPAVRHRAAELPPNCKVLSLFFPNRMAMADATQAITVEGVGYNAFKPGMGSHAGHRHTPPAAPGGLEEVQGA